MNELDFSKLTVREIVLVVAVKGTANTIMPTNDPKNFQVRQPRKQHGLVLILKGKSRYTFQNQMSIETVPGTILYLPKGWKYYVEAMEDTECVCVNFSLLEDVSPEPWIYRPKNFTQWEEMFDRLLRLWKYPALGYKARCKAVLYEMLATIEEDQQIKYLPKDKKERIENAILRMEEEFQKGNNVDIPFLADYTIPLMTKAPGGFVVFSFVAAVVSKLHKTPALEGKGPACAAAGIACCCCENEEVDQ